MAVSAENIKTTFAISRAFRQFRIGNKKRKLPDFYNFDQVSFNFPWEASPGRPKSTPKEILKKLQLQPEIWIPTSTRSWWRGGWTQKGGLWPLWLRYFYNSFFTWFRRPLRENVMIVTLTGDPCDWVIFIILFLRGSGGLCERMW